MFEGEFFNDKRWNGKVKIYNVYEHDFVEFEGEYINGKEIGKEYDKWNGLIFEGEYLYGS